MIEPAQGEQSLLRADLRLEAVTLARLQLGVALALGCERIVCLAQAADGQIAGLRAAAELAGARFHLIAEPRALIGLVTAIDEVVAFGDGLLAWPRTALALLGPGPAVVVQPIESGLAGGFERLDLNHAGGAAIRLPGRLVERLAELPADCDGFSALQRIALQGGVPQRMLPATAVAQGQWTLLRSEAQAHAAEALWVRLQTELTGAGNASALAAQWAVRRLGPALLHAGSGHRVAIAAATLTAMLALVAGRFHGVAAAFVLAALAWLMLCGAGLLARIERETLHLASLRGLRRPAFGQAATLVMDGILAVLMIQCLGAPPGQAVARVAFAPVMLLGLVRLVPRYLVPQRPGSQRPAPQPPAPRGRDGNWPRWLEDRGLLALALAGFGAAGMLDAGIAGMAAALLAAGLFGAAARPPAPGGG